ncbi:unnamed protein product [Discosporangium mesarthrocarpum]
MDNATPLVGENDAVNSGVPPRPVFGNASTPAIGSHGGLDPDALAGISLEDVFSGVFFSPDGDLLDMPSDEESMLTLSSNGQVGGTGSPFAVLTKKKREGSPPDLTQSAAAAAAAAKEAEEAQAQARSKADAAAQAAAAHARAQAEVIGTIGVNWPGGLAATVGGAGGIASGVGAVKTELVAQQGLGSGMSGAGVGVAGGAGAVAGGEAERRSFMPYLPPPKRLRQKVSSKDLTEEQRIERRERNREHAKRSRVRKKFLLDSLQRSVDGLQAENESLKNSIVEHLGKKGEDLVAKCVPGTTSIITTNTQRATKVLETKCIYICVCSVGYMEVNLCAVRYGAVPEVCWLQCAIVS